MRAIGFRAVGSPAIGPIEDEYGSCEDCGCWAELTCCECCTMMICYECAYDMSETAIYHDD